MSDELWARIEPLLVWQRLDESLLAESNAAGALDWSRAVIGGHEGEAFLRLVCGIICFRRLVNLGLC